MNATMEKFGWPATRIAELDRWALMLRPEQCTLGALVLACKEPVRAFSEVSPAAFSELRLAVVGIETMLRSAVDYDKINYLMLMMVDPDVHFHVLPRYAGERTLAGLTVADADWPGPPRLDAFATPDAEVRDALVGALAARWPGP